MIAYLADCQDMTARTTTGTTSMTPSTIMFSIALTCGPTSRRFGLERGERYQRGGDPSARPGLSPHLGPLKVIPSVQTVLTLVPRQTDT